jgi:L-2-hydroxyglutarate oxidase LhgO
MALVPAHATPRRTVAVVGGGVVGLAVAECLSRNAWDVVLIERHGAIGQEASSRNSEVVHAGLYYPPGSLKAQACVEGRERLVTFCTRHRVPWRATGKLIVASEAGEEQELDRILQRAERNGARPLQPLDAQQLRKRFPAVRATQGLWSTGTGIVDSHALLSRLRALAELQGATVLCRHALVGAQQCAGGWLLSVHNAAGAVDDLQTDAVVNAAGLAADSVARLAGGDGELPRHVPVKGSYFALMGPAPVDTLVYPVPPPQLVGLGTHLTLDLAGCARIGPDVQHPVARDDIAVDPARKAAFLSAARRFLPTLSIDQLRPDFAGIRAKLAVDRFADFWLREQRGAPGWIDLLGIESPGLTSSLALAQRVADLLA